jgi:predicted heme/steroid binding protein/uncharacterized membrane protein
LKEFTCEDLSKHNGKDQPTVYIAYGGTVYDVTASKLWKTGSHMKRHASGGDLTAEIAGAPHGAEILDRVSKVGVLLPEKDPMDQHLPDFLVALLKRVPMLRRHPHPMTVHFPLAFTLVIPLFNLLYLATGRAEFESTSFHMLILDILCTAVAMVTGPYAWWVNYGAKLSFNIKIKMSFSAALMVLLLVLFLWRISNPQVLFTFNGAMLAYLSLSLLLPFVVGVLGWFGAKMTFPH